MTDPAAGTEDPAWNAIADARDRALDGDAGARDELVALSEDGGPERHPRHRVMAAFFASALTLEPRDRLVLDRRALEVALTVAPADDPFHGTSSAIGVLVPMLHLQLVDDHLDLDDPVQARGHLAAARRAVPSLPEGVDRGPVSAAVDRAAARLDT